MEPVLATPRQADHSTACNCDEVGVGAKFGNVIPGQLPNSIAISPVKFLAIAARSSAVTKSAACCLRTR